MATKKYLSLDRLTEYDQLIKQEIAEGDSGVKSYVDTELAKKSNSDHVHDDIYYKTEMDTKLSGINSSITNITNGSTPVKESEHATNADSALDADKLGGQLPSYYAKASDIPTGALASKDIVSESDLDTALAEKVNAAAEGNHSHSNKSVLDGITADKVSAWDLALDSAKEYTDNKTSGMATTTVVDNKISVHNTSSEAHADIRNLISELSTKVNNFLDVDDATRDQLSEVLELIDNNKGTLESLTSSKVNVSDIVDNLTTASATKVLSANQGVALKALIDALQAEVDGKSADGHGHEIANISGLQAALNAKAAQTDLDTHTSNTTMHITADERTAWNAAKTHADSAHAPADAQANVIESIKVNGTAQSITGKAVDITVPTQPSDIGAAEASHGHAISEVAGLNDALNSASEAILANVGSINAHNDRIGALETKVGDGFAEITSQEIAQLFAK